MKLIIKQSNWSGWEPDYKPEESENEYQININQKYVIKTSTISYKKEDNWVKEEKEILSFDIIEINDDNIKIKTYQPFSDNEDDSVNLYSDKTEFVITVGKPLKLVTPTMDSGEVFVFTLVN